MTEPTPKSKGVEGWLVGLVAIILVGAVFAAVLWWLPQRNMSSKNACINLLRQIDGAKEQWALEQQKRNGAKVPAEDIALYIKGGIPTCPANGIYSIGLIGENPRCSLATRDNYHWLAWEPKCVETLRMLKSAKAAMAQKRKLSETSEPSFSDLAEMFAPDYQPSCPEGGTYRLGRVNEDPHCSIPAHSLCIGNLLDIDGAKELWSNIHKAAKGTVVNMNEVLAYPRAWKMPLCPDGGTYSFGRIGEPPTCTVPGHSLP